MTSARLIKIGIKGHKARLYSEPDIGFGIVLPHRLDGLTIRRGFVLPALAERALLAGDARKHLPRAGKAANFGAPKRPVD